MEVVSFGQECRTGIVEYSVDCVPVVIHIGGIQYAGLSLGSLVSPVSCVGLLVVDKRGVQVVYTAL